MSIFHIVNGDCLAKQLEDSDIQGEIIICRECLIEGDLSGDSLTEFWSNRAAYISQRYSESTTHYFAKSVSEFEKIILLPEEDEIHLWFEDDLFCQSNMWFILSLLAKRKTLGKVFRIFPTVVHSMDHWTGFGGSDGNLLKQSYRNKIPFTKGDMELSVALWTAYKKKDLDTLISLSLHPSTCFRFLEETCLAHVDRFLPNGALGRPEKAIKDLLNTNIEGFENVFKEFSKQEGVYGFGDSQVKALYDRLKK